MARGRHDRESVIELRLEDHRRSRTPSSRRTTDRLGCALVGASGQSGLAASLLRGGSARVTVNACDRQLMVIGAERQPASPRPKKRKRPRPQHLRRCGGSATRSARSSVSLRFLSRCCFRAARDGVVRLVVPDRRARRDRRLLVVSMGRNGRGWARHARAAEFSARRVHACATSPSRGVA